MLITFLFFQCSLLCFFLVQCQTASNSCDIRSIHDPTKCAGIATSLTTDMMIGSSSKPAPIFETGNKSTVMTDQSCSVMLDLYQAQVSLQVPNFFVTDVSSLPLSGGYSCDALSNSRDLSYSLQSTDKPQWFSSSQPSIQYSFKINGKDLIISFNSTEQVTFLKDYQTFMDSNQSSLRFPLQSERKSEGLNLIGKDPTGNTVLRWMSQEYAKDLDSFTFINHIESVTANDIQSTRNVTTLAECLKDCKNRNLANSDTKGKCTAVIWDPSKKGCEQYSEVTGVKAMKDKSNSTGRFFGLFKGKSKWDKEWLIFNDATQSANDEYALIHIRLGNLQKNNNNNMAAVKPTVRLMEKEQKNGTVMYNAMISLTDGSSETEYIPVLVRKMALSKNTDESKVEVFGDAGLDAQGKIDYQTSSVYGTIPLANLFTLFKSLFDQTTLNSVISSTQCSSDITTAAIFSSVRPFTVSQFPVKWHDSFLPQYQINHHEFVAMHFEWTIFLTIENEFPFAYKVSDYYGKSFEFIDNGQVKGALKIEYVFSDEKPSFKFTDSHSQKSISLEIQGGSRFNDANGRKQVSLAITKEHKSTNQNNQSEITVWMKTGQSWIEQDKTVGLESPLVFNGLRSDFITQLKNNQSSPSNLSEFEIIVSNVQVFGSYIRPTLNCDFSCAGKSEMVCKSSSSCLWVKSSQKSLCVDPPIADCSILSEQACRGTDSNMTLSDQIFIFEGNCEWKAGSCAKQALFTEEQTQALLKSVKTDTSVAGKTIEKVTAKNLGHCMMLCRAKVLTNGPQCQGFSYSQSSEDCELFEKVTNAIPNTDGVIAGYLSQSAQSSCNAKSDSITLDAGNVYEISVDNPGNINSPGVTVSFISESNNNNQSYPVCTLISSDRMISSAASRIQTSHFQPFNAEGFLINGHFKAFRWYPSYLAQFVCDFSVKTQIKGHFQLQGGSLCALSTSITSSSIGNALTFNDHQRRRRMADLNPNQCKNRLNSASFFVSGSEINLFPKLYKPVNSDLDNPVTQGKSESWFKLSESWVMDFVIDLPIREYLKESILQSLLDRETKGDSAQFHTMFGDFEEMSTMDILNTVLDGIQTKLERKSKQNNTIINNSDPIALVNALLKHDNDVINRRLVDSTGLTYQLLNGSQSSNQSATEITRQFRYALSENANGDRSDNDEIIQLINQELSSLINITEEAVIILSYGMENHIGFDRFNDRFCLISAETGSHIPFGPKMSEHAADNRQYRVTIVNELNNSLQVFLDGEQIHDDTIPQSNLKVPMNVLDLNPKFFSTIYHGFAFYDYVPDLSSNGHRSSVDFCPPSCATLASSADCHAFKWCQWYSDQCVNKADLRCNQFTNQEQCHIHANAFGLKNQNTSILMSEFPSRTFPLCLWIEEEHNCRAGGAIFIDFPNFEMKSTDISIYTRMDLDQRKLAEFKEAEMTLRTCQSRCLRHNYLNGVDECVAVIYSRPQSLCRLFSFGEHRIADRSKQMRDPGIITSLMIFDQTGIEEISKSDMISPVTPLQCQGKPLTLIVINIDQVIIQLNTAETAKYQTNLLNKGLGNVRISVEYDRAFATSQPVKPLIVRNPNSGDITLTAVFSGVQSNNDGVLDLGFHCQFSKKNPITFQILVGGMDHNGELQETLLKQVTATSVSQSTLRKNADSWIPLQTTDSSIMFKLGNFLPCSLGCSFGVKLTFYFDNLILSRPDSRCRIKVIFNGALSLSENEHWSGESFEESFVFDNVCQRETLPLRPQIEIFEEGSLFATISDLDLSSILSNSRQSASKVIMDVPIRYSLNSQVDPGQIIYSDNSMHQVEMATVRVVITLSKRDSLCDVAEQPPLSGVYSSAELDDLGFAFVFALFFLVLLSCVAVMCIDLFRHDHYVELGVLVGQTEGYKQLHTDDDDDEQHQSAVESSAQGDLESAPLL